MVAHPALQSPEALLGAGARRRLAVGTCLVLATTASGCQTPSLTGLFDTPTVTDHANRNAAGDWDVRMATGGYCLVFAAQASTAQRAVEVCQARLAGT